METAVAEERDGVAERPSRPPGFDMTYRPEEIAFGPPLRARIPSLLYLALAIGVGALVLIGENSGVNSSLFRFVVEDDPRRVLGIRTLAVVLFVGSLASIARAGMRGIRIYADGVETRDVEYLIVPRVRRHRWAQIERMVLDLKTTVALDLWDGSRAFLPPVSDHQRLVSTLEHVAAARAIPVRGGSGLDEVPEPVNDDRVSRDEAR